jgi:hypothetical protein
MGFALLRVLFGIALLVATAILAVTFAVALVRDPSSLLPRMLLGFGLGLLWLLLTALPS